PSFAAASGTFEIEDTFVAGDRVVQMWRYLGGANVVRGVDVLRVRDGRVAEKFGYVKT
ncbi:MAG: nuclear transport factor 2 family protein, partial [Actinobacteria bacterium]|nr:nuclear transport factor 2 family protein [Actinomycetota bacterium]